MNLNEKTLKERIMTVLKGLGRPASVKEIASEIPDKPESTVRGRLYDNMNTLFKRVARGVYWFTDEATGVLLVEGNGRDLSLFEDNSVDAIITDHPWLDDKSNRGGSRHFDNTYDKFRYTLDDFIEKARVLKKGAFLVEILPAENENNWRYLYEIKDMAEKCGLHYYSKVPWVKGTFISNTGRKSKNTEDILFFTKGKCRSLRPDKKKIKSEGGEHYMSGTTSMLPTAFNVQAISPKKRIHQAEKPIELYEQIIKFITKPGEIVMDQFSGSGNLGVAAVKTKRFACLYEIIKENIEKIQQRFNEQFGSEKVPEQLVLNL